MKYSFIPVLIAICLFSCNKDKSSAQPEPGADPIPQFAVITAKFQNTSKFIRREISYFRNNPHLKNVRIFSYDQANRCTEIKIGTIDSSVSNPFFSLKQTLTFGYDGTSILPSSFASVKTVFPNLIVTYYYKYNSYGRKITDSVRVKNTAGDPADRVIHYEYNNDQVYATPKLTGFPMENNSFDTLSLLKGGNIGKVIAKFIRSTGDQTATYTFTYDQFANPYNKLNIANSLYFEHASLGIGYNVPLETHYMGVTINNMTSWTSGNFTMQFRYLYDRDQYPVRKEMFQPGETTPVQVILFEY
jgi:hypothetical protein